MIIVEPSFVPVAVCRELAACFDRHIGDLGLADDQPAFSYRVVRLRQLMTASPPDALVAKQMRAIRWLATELLRDRFGDAQIYPEETQLVRWSVGDGQPLHLDVTRPTTTYAAIVYLNADFAGGETFFGDGTVVRPRTGMLAAFHGARLLHGVHTVTSGIRLTMPIWFTGDHTAAEE